VRWSWVTGNEAPRLTFEVRDDCRAFFPTLTDFMGLFYIGGDGQEVTPDLTQPDAFVLLPEPLCVGVANGRCPVAGARVRFQIEQGSGRLHNIPAPDPVDVVTDANGIAC
jgi:hypothetical protein